MRTCWSTAQAVDLLAEGIINCAGIGFPPLAIPGEAIGAVTGHVPAAS